jgi:cytochrome c5
MKLFFSAIAITAFSAAIALAAAQQQPPAAQQQPKFPEGPGRVILERACGACHAAESITNYKYETAQEYRDIVESMIATGAIVSQTELPILVDYLYANWGKKPAAAAADPGKAILDAACTTCHSLEVMTNHVYAEKGPYQSLVDNMITFGATVTDAQKPLLVDYMFKTYGKK